MAKTPKKPSPSFFEFLVKMATLLAGASYLISFYNLFVNSIDYVLFGSFYITNIVSIFMLLLFASVSRRLFIIKKEKENKNEEK